jgi:cytochrome c oxidase subunit I+III
MATVTTTPDSLPAAGTLDRTWASPEGIWKFLTAVNHRVVGLRYIVTGLTFFALAGFAGVLMRIQLAVPENTFLNADLYNQIFTTHGTTMMFLFAVPIMEGVGIYLVPLMIGTRDMVFPRLNAFGYFVYLIAGVTIWFSLLINQAPDGGWFNYVPLTGPQFSPGPRIDFYATMITFLEVAALVAAVELILTIFLLRAPGMSLNRVPAFVWAILVMAFMIVFAMPPLMVASAELALDRTVGAHFFNPEAGGHPLLWQHLFWFFGHPEVYIIFIPALGIVAAIVPTFTRRPTVGYIYLVLSFIAVGFLSFGLWVHHMFAVGIPNLAHSFFTVASMMIAVPSGIQIFSAIATMWTGRPVMRMPLVYVLGFIFIFLLGGITGVMLAAVPFDLQVHDTYFVVAHFHYVLIGGAVFPLLAGLYYWFPKVIGRMLDERLGRWGFWLIFIGFHVTFFTMHITGFLGMPRRVYTYLPGLTWDLPNMISTIGAVIVAIGFLVVLADVIKGLRSGPKAGDNPWGAGTLEWATTSPPQNYNFATIPSVRSREPLWDEPVDDPAYHADLADPASDRFGLLLDRRETLGTSILDAIPQQRVVLPGPTIIPFLLALAVAVVFLGVMIDLIIVPIGALLTAAGIIAWHWPNQQQRKMAYAEAGPPNALPTSTVAGHFGINPPFWWGMVMLVLIESVVFASLISTYIYLRYNNFEWPLGPIDPPDLLLPTINATILLASSIPMAYADNSIKKGNQAGLKIGLVICFIMGVVFLVLKYVEYSDLNYNWASNAYGSIVWTITGFHSAHVASLLIKTVVVGVLAFQGYFNERRHAAVDANGLYWHFVVAVWVPLFLLLYIFPRLF